MASAADDPKEMLDFKFRSMRRIKLNQNETEEVASKSNTQKLAVANSLGSLFAGKKYLLI